MMCAFVNSLVSKVARRSWLLMISSLSQCFVGCGLSDGCCGPSKYVCASRFKLFVIVHRIVHRPYCHVGC
jgi:hypothetical protein